MFSQQFFHSFFLSIFQRSYETLGRKKLRIFEVRRSNSSKKNGIQSTTDKMFKSCTEASNKLIQKLKSTYLEYKSSTSKLATSSNSWNKKLKAFQLHLSTIQLEKCSRGLLKTFAHSSGCIIKIENCCILFPIVCEIQLTLLGQK